MDKLKVITAVMVIAVFLAACQNKDEHSESKEPDITDVSAAEIEDGKSTIVTSEEQTSSQETLKETKKADAKIIEQNVQELIKNGSRKWNTDSELLAANYLKKQMESYGYNIHIQEFPAYEFDIMASGNGDYFNLNPYNSEAIGTGHNVIADINTGKETDKVLVMTAHYDTVSKELGIIDNTSGVVTLLEVARLVSELHLPFNLRFIFFSSEERFLYGSRYYVSSLSSEELSKIAACINVDMVGYKNGQELIVATPYFADDINIVHNSVDGVENSLAKEWHRIFPELETFVKVESSSDHFSFEKMEIPNMMITQKYFDVETTRKTDSDLDNLSITELENTINLIKEYIENLDISKVYYENIPLVPEVK
ncbi:Zn-dependent exopeptidase M28 [Anaerocolumna aminovalerica]|uniref:M28 family metallopeptidase n=1 Tax=Anaerocolumna aminovalerica TaxID=1527 RepID=UPI001C0F2014|nr:M28 family metallopeptidase [Anaerocolumna aminovalerica]MBU5330910.1 Zn-dependent exopeptidase M28 [Anaerocolumna aminovalerica]